MTYQIICNPHNTLSLFSSLSETFVLHGDQADIVEYLVQNARSTIEDDVQRVVTMLTAGKPAYYQFTLRYDEALALHNHATQQEDESC